MAVINIDVPSLERGELFYTEAFGLEVSRRPEGFVELLGWGAPVHLLHRPSGSADASRQRSYARHWTPVHIDVIVDDADASTQRAVAAGATREEGPVDTDFGRIALLADPFGHGFCIIELRGDGYGRNADEAGSTP